jgi:hypothetical protein
MNYFPTLKSSDFCYNKSDTPFEYSDQKCNDYTIYTDCAKIIDVNNNKICGLCKNYKFADTYSKLNQGNGKNLLDIKEQYQRSWYQTGNLGVGILFLLVCIYYQK